MLSLPKRLRYFLHHEAGLVNPVLGIFLQEVERALLSCSPDVPDDARFGTVTFVHRFGAALNANLHFHCCVIDGVFSTADEVIRFHPAFLTDAAIERVQQRTRRRMLKLCQRRELLPEDATEMMRDWEHGGGFSLNSEVWVPSWDRAGLERLPVKITATVFWCPVTSTQRADHLECVYLTPIIGDVTSSARKPPRRLPASCACIRTTSARRPR